MYGVHYYDVKVSSAVMYPPSCEFDLEYNYVISKNLMDLSEKFPLLWKTAFPHD